MSWQRDVINLQRSFSMPYPFIAVCGALHLEDIWSLFAGPDPLGLRGRLCLFYTRPVMSGLVTLLLPTLAWAIFVAAVSWKPCSWIYFPIYQAHSTDYRDEAAFNFHLGYPFLNYDFALADDGAAETAFMAAFDEHVALQEENYLVNHEESKRHGKLKGKHLRHAWLFSSAIQLRWKLFKFQLKFSRFNTSGALHAVFETVHRSLLISRGFAHSTNWIEDREHGHEPW